MDKTDKVYSVCHKCGLPRYGIGVNGNPTPKIEDLSYCSCMSQSIFDYELILRTEKEVWIIAQEHYNSFYELYKRQERGEDSFIELAKRYGIVHSSD